MFLDGLKAHGLVDQGATILKEEPFIYEAGSFHNRFTATPEIVEVLQTGHIMNLSNYVAKWKEVLKPYNEVIQ